MNEEFDARRASSQRQVLSQGVSAHAHGVYGGLCPPRPQAPSPRPPGALGPHLQAGVLAVTLRDACLEVLSLTVTLWPLDRPLASPGLPL